MTRVNVFRALDRGGHDAIALILSQNAMFVMADGEPYPGVALSVPQAREIARRLILFASELEEIRPAGTEPA